MKTINLQFNDFRNLHQGQINPCENINIIAGDNAQGKTNIIEAIWLFTGGRSFRHAKEHQMITFDKQSSALNMTFDAFSRKQQALLEIFPNKRTVTLNGANKGLATSIIGTFCTVIFSPTHLNIVKGGPNERRRFVDAAICQIKSLYPTFLSKYQHTLKQRNALLKDIKLHPSLIDTLDVWDYKLSTYAAEIVIQRSKYVKKISSLSRIIYDGITTGKEYLDISYDKAYDNNCSTKENLIKFINSKLKSKQEIDLANKTTSFGPHRDNIEININNKSARIYGSQGQQRSSVLSLKLAEAELIKQENNEPPVILLDDVMSELDLGRQNYLLNSIKDTQVFITCCEPETLIRLTKGKVFKVEQGKVYEN